MKPNKPSLPSYQSPEETKQRQLENWEKAVKASGESLKDTHTQKEYSFSTPELRQMVKLYTIETISHQAQDDKLNIDVLAFILEEVKKGKLSENHIKHVMEDVVGGKDVQEAVKREESDLNDIEEKIMKLIKEKPGLSVNAYMGLAIKDLNLKGKVDGKTLIDIIKKFVK